MEDKENIIADSVATNVARETDNWHPRRFEVRDPVFNSKLHPDITVYDFLELYISLELPETFKKNGIIQCRRNRGRTLEDLTILVQSYIPDATEKEIITSLFKLGIKHKVLAVKCNDVKNITWHHPAKGYANLFAYSSFDIIFCRDFKGPRQKYTFAELNEISDVPWVSIQSDLEE